MSDVSTPTAPSPSSSGPSSSGPPSSGPAGSTSTLMRPDHDSDLLTEHGRTSIADSVVAKIAGVAAREISGVHAMGGGTSRAIGAIREAVSSPSASQGVSVEVGERQAAIDLTLVVDYGASIVDLADGVRSQRDRSNRADDRARGHRGQHLHRRRVPRRRARRSSRPAAGRAPGPVNTDLAERIAERASSVPGVVRLSGGLAGGVGTYAPGRRIEGVRLRDGYIEVHIVAAGSVASLPTVAASVRDAVSSVAPESRIDVFVDDLDLDVLDLDALEPPVAALPAPAGTDPRP